MTILKKLIVEQLFNNLLKSGVWDTLDGKKTYLGILLYFVGVFLTTTQYAPYSEMLINAGQMLGYTGVAHKGDKLLVQAKKWLSVASDFLAAMDRLKPQVTNNG